MAEESKKSQLFWRWMTLGFFIVVAWLITMTFNDYGVSWDEYFRWQGGEKKYEYYEALLSGDSERAAKLRSSNDPYPGLFDLSMACARRVLPLGIVATGHLGVAVFGFIGLVAVCLLGRNIGGPAVGLLAAALLALAPPYWGHLFINPKDVPFAATFALALWSLLRVIGRPGLLTWKSALLFGMLAGAAMSVRIGGLLIFCYAGLFLGLQMLWLWRAADWKFATLRRELLRMLAWLATAAAPAFLMLLFFWPSAHRNPFAATADTLSTVTSFGWQGKALFHGELLGAAEIPRSYLPTMLGVGLPDLWYFVVVSALAVLVITKGRSLSFHRLRRTHAVVAALVFSAIFPVAYIVAKHAVVYDGLRHALFVLPILSVLLAIAVSWIYRSLTVKQPAMGQAWAVCLGAIALFTLWESVRLHPYQYTYFNRLSGGISGLQDDYDVEYWGTAYREAVDLMIEDAYANTELMSAGRPIRVAMIPPKAAIFARYDSIPQPPIAMVAFFLPKGFVLVDSDEAPDYYLGIRRFGFADMLPGEPIAEVSREEVMLARVTRR